MDIRREYEEHNIHLIKQEIHEKYLYSLLHNES